MRKALYAVAAAATIAAALVLLPSFSPQVQAHGPVLGAKGDRVDARALGGKCSQREWPYFEAGCLRDPRQPFGQARAARIIPLDRLPQSGKRSAIASR